MQGTGSFQPNGEPLYDGTQSSWVHEMIDITSYANQQISLRFLFRSDGSIVADGWYVDNVKISVYNSAVPVELTSFNSSIVNDHVQLNWTTATELNNKGFEIARTDQSTVNSRNNNLETVGFVQGNGTSSEVHTYIFKDQNPIAGKLFYRLKQIDFDGSFEYSNIVEVDFGLSKRI